MNQELLGPIIKNIYDFSGINLASSQKTQLLSYIEKRAAHFNVTEDEFCRLVITDPEEFNSIINLVTVNETYFFREEKQFDVLKNEIFPKYRNKKLVIWSSACSTGEEPYSLLALAIECGMDVKVYATDIDDNAIASVKSGVYSKYSFRPDGSKYHSLMEKHGTWNNREFVLDEDFKAKLNLFKFNLTQDIVIPVKDPVDIIFMRNVFIYFDTETRKAVTRKVTSKLVDEGCLFFSMNEIGCINNSIIPDYLTKVNLNSVYYFIRSQKIEQHRYVSSADLSERIKEILARPSMNIKSDVTEKKPEIKKLPAEKNIPEKEKPKAALAKKDGFLTAQEKKDIAVLFEKICAEINRSDFKRAKEIIREFDKEHSLKPYTLFFEGYTEYYADSKTSAGLLFSSAESLKRDFWPAYFYHGLVYKDIGNQEKADSNFEKCMQILDTYKKGAVNPYDFILDSFDPAYIYSLCSKLQTGENDR